ncbi:MAG: serine--tRNA ligase [Candidatus Neomarinimicrobiota bacterium]|nr:MAG: serine--tRNA ligase [Candidatus Neomarinimicrobiota bacterium]
MLDLNFVRTHSETVRAGLAAKGDTTSLDPLLEVDRRHREAITRLNELRARRNRASEAIGAAKRAGKDAQEAIAAMQAVARDIKQLEQEESRLQQELQDRLLATPNLPHASVPRGTSEADNVVVRTWGEPLAADFPLKNHLELGEDLGLFDFRRGAKMSGSGFPLYTGDGARLERALLNFMLDFHRERYGFTEIFPPFVTRPEAMETTGQLPKFAEDMYYIDRDQAYLIPTAEVPVTNIHRDEILDESQLPLRYVAYSACFRREAGSYGKETRGFLRLHQFNKVELVKFVRPDTSYEELESLTAQAEAVLQALGLHYRVVSLSSGDLSFAAAKCYDLEVWAPGERQWLEVSSCSNFEAFQARRGRIRYRRAADKKVDFVHTLNGSGVATPRLLVALLETYQTPEGRVRLPEPLQAYMGTSLLTPCD